MTATDNLTRPRFLVQIASVNEDEGRAYWHTACCAHSERGAWAALDRHSRGCCDGVRVIDTTDGARVYRDFPARDMYDAA